MPRLLGLCVCLLAAFGVLAVELPDRVTSLITAGVEAFTAGDLDAAQMALESAVAEAPESAVAHKQLGVVRYTLDDMADAITSLRTSLALDSASADAHLYLGIALSELVRSGSNLKDAQLPAVSSAEVDVSGSTSTTPLVLRVLSDAISHLQQSIDLLPDIAEPHFQLGMALHWRGTVATISGLQAQLPGTITDLASAAAHYRASVKIDPSCASCWAYLGEALRDTAAQEPDDVETAQEFAALALEALEQATTLEPTNAEYQSSLGLVLVGLNRWEDAASAFQRAVEADRTDGSAWVNLGSALHQAGRLHEASMAFFTATGENNGADSDPANAVVSSKPTLVNAYSGLGMTLKALGQLEFAARAFDHGFDIDRTNVDVATQLIWTHLQLEQVGHAAAALEIAPENGVWWPFIASIQAHLGRRGSIAGAFDQLLQPTEAEADPLLRYASFSSVLLKHVVCAPTDFVLSDKARCSKALSQATDSPISSDTFHAQTFFLPDDIPALKDAARAAGPSVRWIKKASWAANGDGVAFIDPVRELSDPKPDDTPDSEGWIVQRYIDPPYLFRGHKFDLRVFVTVQSVRPLRVYIHGAGWANVADEPYAKDVRASHVTNAALLEMKPQAERECRKFSLGDVFAEIASDRGEAATATVWSSIKRIARQTVLAGLQFDTQWDDADSPPFCASKTYGFDFLLDSDLSVWLVEVNSNPGFDYEGATKYCQEPPMDFVAFAMTLSKMFSLASPTHKPDLVACANSMTSADGSLSSADNTTVIAAFDQLLQELGHVVHDSPTPPVELLVPVGVDVTAGADHYFPGMALPGTRSLTVSRTPSEDSEAVSNLSTIDRLQQRVVSQCLR